MGGYPLLSPLMTIPSPHFLTNVLTSELLFFSLYAQSLSCCLTHTNPQKVFAKLKRFLSPRGDRDLCMVGIQARALHLLAHIYTIVLRYSKILELRGSNTDFCHLRMNVTL